MSRESFRPEFQGAPDVSRGDRSLEEVTPKKAVEWTDEEWKERQAAMKKETFLAPSEEVFSGIDSAFYEIRRQHGFKTISCRDFEAPVETVPTKAIVRAPSLRGWQNSYHTPHYEETRARGENAVIEIARKMAKDAVQGADQQLQQNYFLRDGFPVLAEKIEGPRGPMYFIQDGSHRTAAAKLIGMESIDARVGGLQDPKQAERLWYESLALMPARSREELLRVYDHLYPPTEEERKDDQDKYAQALTYLDEIIEEKDMYNRTLAERAAIRAAEMKRHLQLAEEAERIAKGITDERYFQKVRLQVGLEFLLEHPDAPLWADHLPQIDEDGYILRKDGQPSYIRSVGYDIGNSYNEILIRTVKRYAEQYPDEVTRLRSEVTKST